MPGNSLTNLPRHFSPEELQGLFETVGNARAEAGLPPAELKDIAQAAATTVWAAVVADRDEIGGKYLEDVAVAPVDDTPKETTIDRTRRLFYVTCSRAEESLAVVYYATDPALARDAMIRQGWFEAGEIELIS